MSDTNFTNHITPIDASWLNEVNDHVHSDTVPAGRTAVHDASAISFTTLVGSFTCTAAASGSVTNSNCLTGSIVILSPTNAAAATLLAGANSLYTTPASGSFQWNTAGGGSAVGTETFNYLIVN